MDPEVQRFLLTFIGSVEQLEVLLLLRSAPQRTWTASEVSSELRRARRSIGRCLDRLARQRLAVRAGADGFRYTDDESIEQRVAAVAQTFRERPVSVVTLIYSKGVDEMQTLADAFLFKKGDEVASP